MDRNVIQFAVAVIAFLAVIYPLSVWYGRVGLVFDENLPLLLFPALGLAAFSIMWLHVVGGALREWLSKFIDFQKFVDSSSVAVLFLIILHPILLLYAVGLRSAGSIFQFNEAKYIWLAIIAWPILVGYDILKKFRDRAFFSKHWEKVKLVATIGFFLTLFHSLGVGSDLQSGPLRVVWIFYGISAAVAASYTYGIKKFLYKKRGSEN